MHPLKITLGRRQRRWYLITAAAMPPACVIISLWVGLAHNLPWFSLGLGVVLGAFFAYYGVGLATSYTECTPEHIRTRRLGPPRVTPWTQVRGIAKHVKTGRGTSYYVRVTTTVGKEYYLGGFAASYGFFASGDPEITGPLQQVVDYWHAAAGA